MKSILLLLFFLSSSFSQAAEECFEPRPGLCQLGRVEFKTSALKELMNRSLNFFEPLITKNLTAEKDHGPEDPSCNDQQAYQKMSDEEKRKKNCNGFTLYLNSNPRCRDPEFMKLKTKEALKEKEALGCRDIPLLKFADDDIKIDSFTSGGSNLSFDYDNIRVTHYHSRFLEFDCFEVAPGQPNTCDVVITGDLEMKGNATVQYGPETYDFDDYKMGYKNLKLKLRGQYDEETNKFTLIPFKPGENGFIIDEAEMTIGYSPNEEEFPGLLIETGAALYDRLKDDYENGVASRKSKNRTLERAKDAYAHTAALLRENAKSWSEQRAPYFGDRSPADIAKEFGRNNSDPGTIKAKVNYMCEHGKEVWCQKLKQDRAYRNVRTHFLRNRNQRISIAQIKKMSQAEKIDYACKYLVKKDPTACHIFAKKTCTETKRSFRFPFKKVTKTRNVNYASQCTNGTLDVSYEVPESRGPQLWADMKDIFDIGPAEQEKTRVLRQLNQWISKEHVTLDEIGRMENEIVDRFDNLAYNRVSGKIEELSDKEKNEQFGHLFYEAQWGSEHTGEEGWQRSFNRYKSEMNKIFGPNPFPSNLSPADKAKRIYEHIDQLNSSDVQNEFAMHMLEARNEVYKDRGACPNNTACYAADVLNYVIPEVIEYNGPKYEVGRENPNDPNSPVIISEFENTDTSNPIQEMIGKSFTAEVLNPTVNDFNATYSHMSPFGGGQSYENTPIPCLQCLIDNEAIKTATQKQMKANSEVGKTVKDYNVPKIASNDDFDEWLALASGVGLNDNPCIKEKDRSKVVAGFSEYYGVTPLLHLGDVKDQLAQMDSDLEFHQNYSKMSSSQKSETKKLRKELRRRMQRIEEASLKIEENQDTLKTTFELQTNLEIVDHMNQPGDPISRLNMYSDLACNDSKKCVDDDVKRSTASNDSNDASIFLNVEAVNSYLKKLHEYGIFDVCKNMNGRSCAQSRHQGNKCTEPKILNEETGKYFDAVHSFNVTEAPQVRLNSDKGILEIKGESRYSQNPIPKLDPYVDFNAKVQLIKCDQNSSRTCMQNRGSVAKVLGFFKRRIDKDVNELLKGMGVSNELQDQATQNGFGFEDMEINDIIIHKCSIELKANFINKE